MQRVAKLDGIGNIVIEDVPMPEIGPREVLIEVHCSLISRGSELGGRYLSEGAVDASRMGYAAAGLIARVGDQVTEMQVGDRVAALKPHAEYVTADLDDPHLLPAVVKLPDDIPLELGTFWPFGTSGWAWTLAGDIQPGDTVAVVGQGLVGSTMMQIVREQGPDKVIAIDALPLRCELAAQLGADEVINAAETDPVQAVRDLTRGRGANVVFEAVGGKWAISAFPQVQDMVARLGNIVLIGLYQGEPLPLDAAKAQSHRIIGGWCFPVDRPTCSDKALELLSRGVIRGGQMITHRLPFTEAPAAFDLLNDRPSETLGVLLEWK